jgi:hypothetical protein
MWYTDEIDNFIIKICKKAIVNCIKSNDNKNKKKQACNIIKSLKQLIKGEWFAFICEESQDNFDFKFSHINEENIMIFRYKGYEIYICLLYISLKVSANFDEEKTILNDDNNQNDIKNIIMKNDNIAKKNENKDEIINNQENNIIKNQVSIEFNNNEIKNNNNNNINNSNSNFVLNNIQINTSLIKNCVFNNISHTQRKNKFTPVPYNIMLDKINNSKISSTMNEVNNKDLNNINANINNNGVNTKNSSQIDTQISTNNNGNNNISQTQAFNQFRPRKMNLPKTGINLSSTQLKKNKILQNILNKRKQKK